MKTNLPKIPRLWRYIYLGMFFHCLFAGAAVAETVRKSAQSIEDIYLSIEAESSDLEEIFTLVSEKTGFNFHYKYDIAKDHILSVKLKDVTLGACLRYISDETGLSFRRINETIHVDKVRKAKSAVTEIITSQSEIKVSGRVTISGGEESLPGASVFIKGTVVGTTTDIDGYYSITVPSSESVLVFYFLGYVSEEIVVGDKTNINVALEEDTTASEEVVIVGYGEQKKESVVGAITQTTGEVLERSGGISNVGAALTGNLPGVITMSSSGLPGEEDPMILIRAASSWNNRQPLVLVDGIERPMSSVDISSVKSISVLKDASATAVFGVKGANGVILITTKRGKEGSAKIDASVTATLKAPSKLPNKYDSYDALRARNVAIEHELGVYPDSWAYIKPQNIIDKYRYPANFAESERYPNVDWQDALFKDHVMSYQANVNVSGGTDFVKYFAAADFVHEGDIFRIWDNGRDYESGYGYNRLNVRSNLDFKLSNTTVFKANLAGSNGAKQSPWGQTNSGDWAVAQQWAGAYNIAPDVFLPQYADGSWGYYPNISNVSNSASNLALAGVMTSTTTRLNTDFILEQDLKAITKGLTFRGSISWDNVFVENNRGVNDLFNDAQQKWIDPDTGTEFYKQEYDDNNKFDFMQGVLWSTNGGSVDDGQTQRNVNYQMRLNWARGFGKHNITGMGMVSREERATGSQIPNYREDWVFRATYDYATKYFVEYNGAYNGSEKFAQDYRFAFFNSGALGWMISEESFMKSLGFLDMMKLRGSYGEIGDDDVRINGIPLRFIYMTQWSYGGNSSLDLNQGTSPYTWYREAALGNPDVRWETVKKLNVGMDFEIFGGLFAGSVDVFRDDRVDILVDGNTRAVPSYYGATPPTANLGEVRAEGFEVELNINKVFSNNFRLWADLNMTHAKNTILERDDPQLYPDYRKQAGFSINQTRTFVDAGYLNTYDQLYGSTIHDTNDGYKVPGDYKIVDFNGDGVIDDSDRVPYGYSDTPQNTYNATVGVEWKGLSAFVQLYGVSNVTRDVPLNSFGSQLNTVYDMGTWWSEEVPNADVTVPRWLSTPSYHNGTQYLFDGSYIRLKNAEIAYTFTEGDWIKNIGVTYLKIYVSGNNLWVWSKMPDDRENNFAGAGGQGAYPTMKRYNLGIRFTL